MELLHDAPPGFDGIANAFAMAKLLPTTHRADLRIGLVRGGVLFASGRLDGFRQVNFFADHVRREGWKEHLLGGDDEMYGCDMLFVYPASTRAPEREPQEDPSFIRRAAVELWPATSHHANH
jgi:hypothetical protein